MGVEKFHEEISERGKPKAEPETGSRHSGVDGGTSAPSGGQAGSARLLNAVIIAQSVKPVIGALVYCIFVCARAWLSVGEMPRPPLAVHASWFLRSSVSQNETVAKKHARK